MAKGELKNKNTEELKTLLFEKRNLLRDFRFKVAKGRSKNTKEGKNLRKEIARILTEVSRLKIISKK